MSTLTIPTRRLKKCGKTETVGMRGPLCTGRQQRGTWKHELSATSGLIQSASKELFVGVPDLPWNVVCMSAPVFPVMMGLYKITRGGFEFINGRAVLIVTHWISVPTEVGG